MFIRLLFGFICCLLLACNKGMRTETPPCGSAAIISDATYTNTPINNYNIVSAIINGNCLEVKFASSGCSGNTWVAELIDSGSLIKTNPPQRLLKLKLTNNELCTAYFSKTVAFDISGLKVAGNNNITLNLAGYNGQLIYHY